MIKGISETGQTEFDLNVLCLFSLFC